MRKRLEDAIPSLLSRVRWKRRSRQHDPVIWCLPFYGGVGMAVRTSDADALRGRARLGDGQLGDVALWSRKRIDGHTIVIGRLEPAWFAERALLSVELGAGRFRTTFRFEVGPGRYAGHADGISDYHLEGWAIPLFDVASPSVELMVDGVPRGARDTDRIRPEFGGMGRHSGWYGFRLPLPVDMLDGAAHEVAVRAGDTLIGHGPWKSAPALHIDSCRPGLVHGWYFEGGSRDSATTLRLVRSGRTIVEQQTAYAPDLAQALQRGWGRFQFAHPGISAGVEIAVVAGGCAVPVGALVDGLADQVQAERNKARSLLLEGDPAASLEARGGIRSDIVSSVRRADVDRLVLRPARPVQAAPDSGNDDEPAGLPSCCAIVPVYNGLSDLRRCLDSLIPQLRIGEVRAIVIDDASPDRAVGAFLATLDATAQGALTILANERNLGFVGTVNRGLSLLSPDEDAIIVNADTILPEGAIKRLARHCHAAPGIGSVTPMSNNATILSFPSPAGRNDPLLGATTGDIDLAFQEAALALGGSPVRVPTGIGFCFYMNRRALAEVGAFADKWGRGYCEEVDWCLSARDLGWHHVVAPDTFVMHEGSVSFGVAERLKIVGENHRELERLYPEYLGEIGAFAGSDPLAELRIEAFARLAAARFDALTVQVTHGLGGGTQHYIQSLDKLAREPRHALAVLSPAADGANRLTLVLADATGSPLELREEHLARLLTSLEGQGIVVDIHINSRLSFSTAVLDVLSGGRWRYAVTLHDFQWYCPRVTLTDQRRFYCGEPDVSICQGCVRAPNPFDFGDQETLIETDLVRWLSYNRTILAGASRLIAPSEDTADRYRRRLGIDSIETMAHPEFALGRATRRLAEAASPDGLLRLVVVGAIVSHKGYELLLGLAETAARTKAPILITIVGYTVDDERISRFGNVAVTGRYRPDELGGLIGDRDPDFVFLPSVWPETYSYVLSEVLPLGYPVVAFDFGAPAERLRAHGVGLLIPPTNDPGLLIEALLGLRDRLGEIEPYRPPPPSRPTLDAYLGLDETVRDPTAASGATRSATR